MADHVEGWSPGRGWSSDRDYPHAEVTAAVELLVDKTCFHEWKEKGLGYD